MKPPCVVAVDIGNSSVRIGLVANGRILGSRRLDTSGPFSPRATKALKGLLAATGTGKVDGVAICSVVPRRTEAVRAWLRRATGRAPVIITSGMKTGLRLCYETPETLGVDRLCAAAAAYARYGGPVIVVDFGTATTVDYVTGGGAYLGGAICPGIATSARALHTTTAQLPEISLALPPTVIGRDTRSSLQSGIVFGAIGAMEGLVERYRRLLGKRGMVVATGGFATLVASQSAVVDIVNPNLVIEGAALIWKKHRGG